MTPTIAPTTISAVVDVPESVFTALNAFLDAHPTWSHDQAVTVALCLFLMQHGTANHQLSRTYLDGIFGSDHHA